jgi:hypothetical protein
MPASTFGYKYALEVSTSIRPVLAPLLSNRASYQRIAQLRPANVKIDKSLGYWKL